MISEQLWEALVALPGVEERCSSYKDVPALWVDDREVAHLESESVLDVRLTRARIRERRVGLRDDQRVRLRASSSADWVELHVHDAGDDAWLLELVEAAVRARTRGRGSTE